MTNRLTAWRVYSSLVVPFAALGAVLIGILFIGARPGDDLYGGLMLLLAVGALAGYEQADVQAKHPELQQRHGQKQLIARRMSQAVLAVLVVGLYVLWRKQWI